MFDLTNANHAYLFGLLQTDGHHSGDPDKKGKVTLELSGRDAEILPKLAEVIPCYSSITTRTRTTNYSASYESALLRFFNQQARQDLARLGLPPGRKAHTVTPPPGPLDRPAYLRGLLDGDGSLGFTATDTPFISFVTVSEPLARYVAEVFTEVGGSPRTPGRNTRDNAFNVMVANVQAQRVADHAYPSDDTLALARKLTLARQLATWAPAEGKAWRYGVEKKRWTPAEDDVVRSHDVPTAALKLGRTEKSVQVRRARLHVGVPVKPWTADEDAIVLSRPAAQAARELGRGVGAVQGRRKALGAPSVREPWTPQEDATLLSMSNRDAAAQLGRTEAAVVARRSRLLAAGD